MKKSLVYTRNDFRAIADGAIAEWLQGSKEADFNAWGNDARFDLALRFRRSWRNTYIFVRDGGLLWVTAAAFEMTVRSARKHGVPVFLDEEHEFALFAQA
jgi:hypothetical protein